MKVADMVTIGGATLYLADCAEVLPALQIGPDWRCVTDVPYAFVASGGGQYRAARKGLDKIEAAELDQGVDPAVIGDAGFPGLVTFCHNDQLPHVLPFLKDRYDRAVVCGWHKSNPQPVCNKHYPPDTEFWIHVWNRGAHPVGTIKDLARYWIGPNGAQKVYDHPTVKPITLMRKIVRNVGGAVIVDPYMGTATTGAAALIEGRRFIGIEKRETYFAMAVDRISKVYRDGLARHPLSSSGENA